MKKLPESDTDEIGDEVMEVSVVAELDFPS